MQVIESLADVQAGDFGFGPIGGLVGAGASAGMAVLGEGTRYPHAFMVSEQGGHQPKCIQAMPRGAEEIEMTERRHWNGKHLYVRPPWESREQAVAAVWHARQFVTRGVGYSFASYPALAAVKFHLPVPHLKRWIDRRDADGYPREAICSVLVDQAAMMAGLHLFADGTWPQSVTPGKLIWRMLNMPGAVYGWPS